MKRFAFRLESVLKVRQIQEDQARARLTLANRDVQLAREQVEQRQRRYDAMERPLGVFDHDGLERAWFTLDAAAGSVRHAHELQVGAEIRAHELRHEWVEAKRRAEIVERLRVRAHDEWLVEARRDETRTNDELARRPAARKAS